MPDLLTNLLWPLATLLPAFFLVKWAHGGEGSSPLKDFPGAFLGIIAMLLAWGSEYVVANLGQPAPGFWLAVFVPAIEESWRWVFLQILPHPSISRATWLGAFMGATETFLKIFLGAGIDTSHGFRVLATGPLHALLGGILQRGPAFLFFTIFLHGLFNSGFLIGTTRGFLVSLAVVWVTGIFWLNGISEETENLEAAARKKAEEGDEEEDLHLV